MPLIKTYNNSKKYFWGLYKICKKKETYEESHLVQRIRITAVSISAEMNY